MFDILSAWTFAGAGASVVRVPANGRARIVIADDHKAVAERLATILAEEFIVVATVSGNGSRLSAPPELIVRGFGDSEPLLDELRAEAAQVLDHCLDENLTEIKLLQEHLHDGLAQLVYDRTGRRPMILPVIVEV